jgi:23S rRNA pseudouridine1911/1915/1917 synthase
METTEPVFDTRHLIVPERGRLSELLPAILDLSTERVSELLYLGSVYLNKKRVLEDLEVPPLSYVRVHCKPKRYEVANIDWKSRVVFENDHAVVVNKPSGFSVPSALDNVRETVVAQIQKVVGHKLFVTQRLDVLTSGLFVFAKTPEFQRSFNGLLANGLVHKEYLARTSGQAALGLHTHFMKRHWGSPKEVFLEPQESDSRECRLEVLATENKGEYFHTSIRLLTGRTHQIRAQMKALGCPLWGDKLYSAPGPTQEYMLTSSALRFDCPLTQQTFAFSL